MSIKLKRTLTAVVAAIAGTSGVAARGAVINVPNASFENPAVANVSPYASPLLDDWQKDGNFFSTGAFYNTADVPPIVDNASGNQLGFIFAVPGVGLYQDLASLYTVGQSYNLTIGIQGGGGGMPLNTPIVFRLYYRDTGILVGDNRVTIATATYKNNNASGSITHLTDVPVNLAAVTAGNAWAGKPIGIQMIATDDPAITEAGYFDLDNVRLTSVPEPTALGAIAVVVAVAGLRRNRRRRA